MPEIDVGQLIVYIVVLLFAISAHEAAHAWMSSKFGDDTARALGRVTLNPIAHTDPIGTLLIPIVGFIFAAAGSFVPLIGWGKPTPVNPLRWRNKDTANVMVSGAGIMANTLIAVCALLLVKVFQWSGLLASSAQLRQTGSLILGGSMPAEYAQPVALILIMTIIMNASLAVFNLLPFPPLDGSKILDTFLPSSMRPILDTLEQYGFLILMVLLWFGVFRAIFAPIYAVIQFILML